MSLNCGVGWNKGEEMNVGIKIKLIYLVWLFFYGFIQQLYMHCDVHLRMPDFNEEKMRNYFLKLLHFKNIWEATQVH